jgi:sec-independent protein translocase protein TatA
MNFGNAMRPGVLIVLIVVLILLFGAKRLPDAARALGRSMRIIKAETRDLVGERPTDDLDEKADAQAAREPLPRESGSQAATGEIIDPPKRTRER